MTQERIKQPNSKMCFVCGLENPIGLHLHIYETEPGVVESIYIAPEHFQGYPGVLHGGIVASLLDEISGRAHMGSDPAHPRFMFTGKLEVKYRKNVPVGSRRKSLAKPESSEAKWRKLGRHLRSRNERTACRSERPAHQRSRRSIRSFVASATGLESLSGIIGLNRFAGFTQNQTKRRYHIRMI